MKDKELEIVVTSTDQQDLESKIASIIQSEILKQQRPGGLLSRSIYDRCPKSGKLNISKIDKA